LFYFDGTRYFSPLRSGELKGIVGGMAEDSDGGVWLSSTSGIYRFYKDRLERIVDGVAHAGITQVAPDVFLATVGMPSTDFLTSAKALRIARGDGGWKSETIMPSVSQTPFRLDHSGSVLYGCPGGFCEVLADAIVHWQPGATLRIAHHLLALRTNYAEGISVVLRDKFGCVWLRSPNDAAYVCPSDSQPTALSSDLVGFGYPLILELNDGSVVIPSYSVLTIGRPGAFRMLTKRNGYPGTAIVSLNADGSLWLNSGHVLPLHTRMEFWSAQDGLERNVRSILHIGSKVYAVSGNSVRVLDESRSQWQTILKLSGAASLLAAPGGTILVGSHDEGVVQIDAAGIVVRRSSRADITTLARTPDGQIWALGRTVFRVLFAGNRLSLEPDGAPYSQGSTGDMKVDRGGRLWSCYEGGLAYRGKDGWHALPAQNGRFQTGCEALALDKAGDVWYGYRSVEAFSLIRKPDGVNPSLERFASGGEVGSAATYFLDSDHRGWLWRGAVDGVYVADPEQARQGNWLRLGSEDGIPDANTNIRSFFEDADGSVWFGAEDWLIHLYPPPDLIHPNYAPSVFISPFSLNGSPTRMVDSTNSIASGSDINVHIGALQFDRPNALGLRYRLLPDHAAWTTTQSLNLHLGKLGWGRHTLQVQARLQPGPWSALSEHSFSVLRPAWLSWPALLLLGTGGGTLGAGVSRWRKRQRIKRDLILPDLASWRMRALSPETGNLIGTVIDGRYEIGHILSIGGFATVVRARDSRRDGTLCAVKLFRYEVGNQAWIRHRFDQEVTALEQLAHPNIVRITGHGTVNEGAPYLVMEFIHGQSLRAILENGALPPKLIARFLGQLASALETLHKSLIFHRDLKPENFIIRSDEDNEPQIVIIDFSIAIVKSPDQTFHGISRVAGTLEYMAPEQVIGYADATTDIYSLAKVLLEMLSGLRWADLLPQATLNIPDQVRNYLIQHQGQLTSESIEMISSALMFDPERRPHSASVFVEPVIRDLSLID